MPTIQYTIGNNASETMQEAHASQQWQSINWHQAIRIVKNLQTRIAKAVKAGKWRVVRALQRLLTRSTAGKVLAIRRVTENTGSRTAGIDGQKWETATKKFEAIHDLGKANYKAQAVRRIYIPKSNGKKRPLGIPTMIDRAEQALHLLGLDPISETQADKSSYGFRPYRSCADAIGKCFLLLRRSYSPEWILEGDIKGCFDHISHDWLLQHIPMNKRVLEQWLKSGYLDKRQLFPTQSGTPQGSVISPTLANMVLDGLSHAIDEALGIRRKDRYRTYKNPHKVHLVRYADDFIVMASSKEVLEQKVRPAIEVFLAQRGLQLSAHKTFLTHIDQGFDFLGKHLRKYDAKLLVKPSKQNVQTFLNKVRQTIRAHRADKTIFLIYRLNDMIRGWAMYHRMDNAKATFRQVDNQIWNMLWKWALRRHPNKSPKWVKQHYYTTEGKRNWVFFAKDEFGNKWTLIRAGSVPIKYQYPIRADANPYDPDDELYFEQRQDKKMLEKIEGKRRLRLLYQYQKGRCPVCKEKITEQTGWHTHHITPKYLGGTDELANLVLLHPVCHVQVHANIEQWATAVCFR